jgi:mannose-6-phosphate isomerase-like protein (cupin superfamily)
MSARQGKSFIPFVSGRMLPPIPQDTRLFDVARFRKVAYSYGSIDAMGDGVFRKVRRELGVTAFGVNVVVLAPRIVSRAHYHDEQDELYFVHRGQARFDVAKDSFELGPGGLVHVESTTPRRVTNVGDEELVLLVVGAKDGYVGRDGRPAPPGSF